jgi:predicted nucleic acid-binding protein
LPTDKPGNPGPALMDTGFFVALRNNDDDYHEDAVDVLDRLMAEGRSLVTSDYVLDEAVTTAWRRTNRREAYELGRMILDSDHVTVKWTDESITREALEIFRKYHDKDFSFTDSLLLALAAKEGIGLLVTCEDEFERITDGPQVLKLKK